MWFKGLLVLSQAALLIAPTNAALQGQDGVAGKQNHNPRALAYGDLHVERRVPPHGRNQTETLVHDTSTVVTKTPISVPVDSTTDVEPTTPPTVPVITTTSTTSSSSSPSTSSTSLYSPSSTSTSSTSTSSSTTSSSTTSSSTTSSSTTSSTTTSSTSTTSSSTSEVSIITPSPTHGTTASESSSSSSSSTSETSHTTPIPTHGTTALESSTSSSSTSSSTILEGEAPTANSTTSTHGIPTSESLTKVVPPTDHESTTTPTKTPHHELPNTSKTTKSHSSTSKTSETTGAELPPKNTPAIPTLLDPSENPTNTTADATDVPPTKLPTDKGTTTKIPVSPTPTDTSQDTSAETSAAGTMTPGLPLGPILNPSETTTSKDSTTSKGGIIPTITPPLTLPTLTLPTLIGEPTDVTNDTSNDGILPTILTTNSQGIPGLDTSGLLPTFSSGLIPTITSDLLPTITSGLIPSETSGLLSSITSGLLSSITSDLIPIITPGIIPSVTPGVVPDVTPGVIPNLTPGVIPSLVPDLSTNGTIGIPVSETLLPTLSPSQIISSLTDGVTLPGASGTGNTLDTTSLASVLPTLVDTSKLNTIIPNPAATNVIPTEASANSTLTVPTPSGGSAVTSGKISTTTSKTETGIPATEDGPRTTLLPSPGSVVGGSNTSSIITSAEGSRVSTNLPAIPTGSNTTGVVIEETTPKPSAIPTSEHRVGTDPDKEKTLQDTLVPPPTFTTPPIEASARPSDGPRKSTSEEDGNPITSDATFGTYLASPTGYVPGTSTEPLIAFPTGPSTGKDSEAPPPPLSKQQTAGIAIGGTVSLLMALVAALFLARRYHNGTKRNSTGSVYPEVAYLYDPPVGGNGDAEAGGAVPTMSGGNGGAVAAAAIGKSSPRPHTVDYSTLPQNSPSYPPASFGAGNRAASPQPAQNPFRDPEADAPFTANAVAQQNPSSDPVVNVTKPSPRTEYDATPKTTYADLAALAIKPYAMNEEYPPLSPYSSAMSEDHSVDPFEHDNHDLILNVEAGTETEVSIVVRTSPHAAQSPFPAPQVESPTLGGHYEPPAPLATHFPGRDSRCNSFIPGRHSPESRYMPERHMSFTYAPPEAPFGKLNPSFSSSTPSLLLGSQYGRNSPDSSLASSASSRTTITPEPIKAPARAASPPPMYRGWDDIMHDAEAVPAPLSVATTRKPVPSRNQPTVATQAKMVVATPLIIKKKPVVGATLSVPPSPYGMPSKTETMSDDPVVQRKRSGELLFAAPHLVGKELF